MNFTPLDTVILIAYLAGITWFGIKIAGKQTSTKDYFLGGRKMPWLVVCFSIVATETSALTFISIPGLAYVQTLTFFRSLWDIFWEGLLWHGLSSLPTLRER